MENLKDGDLVYYLAGNISVIASVINSDKFIDHIDAGACVEIQYVMGDPPIHFYRVNILKSEIDKYLFKDKDSLLKAFTKKHGEDLLKTGTMIDNLRDLESAEKPQGEN